MLQRKKFIKSIDKEVTFHVWDTAGQEYYDSLTKKYYRGAHVAIFVFSVIDRTINRTRSKENLEVFKHDMSYNGFL